LDRCCSIPLHYLVIIQEARGNSAAIDEAVLKLTRPGDQFYLFKVLDRKFCERKPVNFVLVACMLLIY
jgi:hypothetical protein